MKRLALIIITSFLLMMLSACSEVVDSLLDKVTSDSNNSAEEVNNNESNENEAEETNEANENESENNEEEQPKKSKGGPKDSSLITEVYSKALAAAEKIDNQEIHAKVVQDINFDHEPMIIESDFIISISNNPLVMHQKGTSQIDLGDGDAEKVETEMYVTDDDIYIYFDMMDQWINLGGAMGGILDAFDDDVEPMDYQTSHDQLLSIESNLEHFTIEETKDTYVLSLYADQDSSKETLNDIIQQTNPGDMEELFEGVDLYGGNFFEEMELIMTFDKKTYHTLSFEMNLLYDFEEDGSYVYFSQRMKSEYVKTNQLGPIEIPEEVKDGGSFW